MSDKIKLLQTLSVGLCVKVVSWNHDEATLKKEKKMNEWYKDDHAHDPGDNVTVMLSIIAQLPLPKTVISMLDNSAHKSEGSISASS